MLFDTHCHLDDEAFSEDVSSVVSAAKAAGVELMLTQGTTISSSLDSIALAEAFPGVYAAVAIHPNCLLQEIPQFGSVEAFLELFTKMAENPKVRAIGETGLDLYWDDTPLDVQKKYLAAHYELSRRTKLPVVIHCRDAEEPLLEVTRADFEKNGPTPGVIHSFSGNTEFLAACLELGFHISFSGCVTFTNKKLDALRETVPLVPEEKILVETDSPYLAPVPYRGKVKRNSPELVVHTARFLAELRGVTEEAFGEQTTRNAKKLFKLTNNE